jgi:pyruvate kinase
VRATKIVATVGPACDVAGVLDALVAAGMDVARLNASHTARVDLERRLAGIRAAAERAGRHIAVMLDLGGPKLRVGEMAPDAMLATGSQFTIVDDGRVGDASTASIGYPGLAGDVAPGDRILLDDGAITLRVTGSAPGRIDCAVEIGGPLGSHKGVNVPGVRLALDAVTPKDIEDLEWALGAGVDLIAQSFVRDAGDVVRLRELMGSRSVPIVAKVEKHEAVAAIAGIIEAADAVMVARGDLGVETSPEDVPVIQRAIVAACRNAGRPVVVATQMLESMVHASRPTRAEASDVAGAVFEGADAVMLSAETAVGEHPVLALDTMAGVCMRVEAAMSGDDRARRRPRGSADDVTAAVSAAVAGLAEELSLAAIVTATESGGTARAVAARRPGVPIVAITPEARIARQLALVHGVHPRVVGVSKSIEETAETAASIARSEGFAREGDLVALTAGVALNRPGTTDLIRVLHV